MKNNHGWVKVLAVVATAMVTGVLLYTQLNNISYNSRASEGSGLCPDGQISCTLHCTDVETKCKKTIKKNPNIPVNNWAWATPDGPNCCPNVSLPGCVSTGGGFCGGSNSAGGGGSSARAKCVADCLDKYGQGDPQYIQCKQGCPK